MRTMQELKISSFLPVHIWQRLFVAVFYVTEANAKGLVLIDDGYFPEQGELF